MALLSPDARHVVVIRSYRDRDSQAEVLPFTPNAASALVEVKRTIPLGKEPLAIWLSGDGKTLLVSGYGLRGGERVAAFDLTAEKEREKPSWEFTYPSPDDHRLMNCISTDGKRVVLQFLNGDMELWDGPAGKLVRDLPKAPGCDSNPGGEHPSLGLSPDGKRIAITIRRKNGEVGGQVIDLETGRKLVALSSGPMPPLAGGIAFSPDGKRLALASLGFVRVWDAETGRDVRPPTGHRGSINSTDASPDGRTVVTAGADMTVRGWDPATGREKWPVAFPQPVLVSFTTADAVVVEYAPSFDLTRGLEEPLLDLATGKSRALPGDMAKGILGNDPQRFGPVLERAVILSNGPTLEIEPEVFASATAVRSASASPPMPSSSEREGESAAGAGPTPMESLEANSRNHILAALEQSGWVIDGPQGAAKILALHPNTLRSRMKKLGIARAP